MTIVYSVGHCTQLALAVARFYECYSVITVMLTLKEHALTKVVVLKVVILAALFSICRAKTYWPTRYSRNVEL